MAAGPREGVPEMTEAEATHEGVRYVLEQKVILRLGTDGDPYDKMLDNRVATIHRILWDVDGKLYLGVTIDDDPGAELMRDTGRFHFFFVGEVELV
ncbi:MAG: hypothetical protein H0V29_03020 [Thermoleophilaceae bacterium]|nr:hypothetical protein [Thermoleophilaceae bacterium]